MKPAKLKIFSKKFSPLAPPASSPSASSTLLHFIQPNMKQMYQGSLGVNIQNLLWPLSFLNGLSQDRSDTLSKIGLIIIILQRKWSIKYDMFFIFKSLNSPRTRPEIQVGNLLIPGFPDRHCSKHCCWDSWRWPNDYFLELMPKIPGKLPILPDEMQHKSLYGE